MAEIWRDIDGYQGYQVSNLGRVRTHNKKTYTSLHGERTWKDRILKPKVTNTNSLRVELWKDGSHKTVLVHRLVADAFLGKMIDTDMTVNHKDGNRLNNRVENLEWISRADNIRYGFENGQYPQTHCTLIDKENHEYHFRSMAQASLFLNRSRQYISNCLKHGQTIRNSDGLPYVAILGV